MSFSRMNFCSLENEYSLYWYSAMTRSIHWKIMQDFTLELIFQKGRHVSTSFCDWVVTWGLGQQQKSGIPCYGSSSGLIFIFSSVQFSSVAQSCPTLQPHESQHTKPPCPSPTPAVYSNSCPWSQWCHPAISSSVVAFSSCPQFLPASGSFPMSQLFTSGGWSFGVSASASVLPMNTQDLSPSGWTGWISLQSKGLSRVFSNTTVQKHQFFGAQLSSQSNSHIHTKLLEKP